MEHRFGDAIVAVASPAGRGAVAVLRISGPAAAVDVIQHTLVRRALPARRMVVAGVWDGDSLVDRGMAVRFVGPGSATGEDVLELHLHGNPHVARRVLGAAVAAGARPAGPGEFTRRALRAGRLDLVQAEAVDALIRAETEQAAALAARQLGGSLTPSLRALRATLLDVAAALEAAIDFPDEVEPGDVGAAIDVLAAARDEVEVLRRASDASRAWLDPARVVLSGPVNAGKSSLFNSLLGAPRAIVSELPGTTRDVVSESVIWDGVTVRLEDTAGLRAAADPVEAEGIRRAERGRLDADLLVEVRDGRGLTERAPAAGAAVATHRDALDGAAVAALEASGWLVVDARSPTGAQPVQRRLSHALGARPLPSVLVHTDRQRRCVQTAAEALVEATNAGIGEPAIAATAVRAAGEAIAELAGDWTDEAVLDALFARFCIGK